MIKTILYLSVGAYGSTGIIEELRSWEEREFRIIGVDINAETHGAYLCDKFYQVPRYTDPKYLDVMREIVRTEEIDICGFGHTMEMHLLQKHDIVPALVAPPEVSEITMNKRKTYDLFPEYAPKHTVLVKTSKDRFWTTLYDMGYPYEELCVKPIVSSGGRGFRIIAPPSFNATPFVFSEKHNPYIKPEDLFDLDFPPLLLMERLKGKNYHVDILAKDGEIKKAVVSYRTAELEGLGFCLKTTTEKPEYLDMAVTIVKRLGLSYNCFFQVMGDKLLEVGSRSAGSVPIGRDLVLGAIELYEGQEPNPRVEQCTMLRHWVPMFIEETK